MKTEQYEGVSIDKCETCNGIWLDYSELTDIVRTKEEKWSNDYIKQVTKETGKIGIPDSEKQREVLCPICDQNMPPINYQYSSGIIVNKCLSNHGVWFDSEELDKIQIYMEHWNEKALQDKSQYNNAIAELKLQHDERLNLQSPWRLSSSKLINALLFGIMNIIDL